MSVRAVRVSSCVLVWVLSTFKIEVGKTVFFPRVFISFAACLEVDIFEQNDFQLRCLYLVMCLVYLLLAFL